MLLPHRKKAGFLASYETAADAFYHKEDLMDKSMRFTHFSFAADIDAAISRITHYREELKAVAAVESQAPSFLHSDLDDENCDNDMEESNLLNISTGSSQHYNNSSYGFSVKNQNADNHQLILVMIFMCCMASSVACLLVI